MAWKKKIREDSRFLWLCISIKVYHRGKVQKVAVLREVIVPEHKAKHFCKHRTEGELANYLHLIRDDINRLARETTVWCFVFVRVAMTKCKK